MTNFNRKGRKEIAKNAKKS